MSTTIARPMDRLVDDLRRMTTNTGERRETGTGRGDAASTATRGFVTSAIALTMMLPIGVEPRNTIEYNAMTRPRYTSSLSCWRRALLHAM